MSLLHDHHHHHGDGHDHDHDEVAASASGRSWVRRNLRYAVAALILAGAVASACLVVIHPGEAVVVTRFGDPVRVLTEPGLAWRLPAPIEATVKVDLRLRTTASGLQDVGTRDGLRVLVQAFVAWQVPADAERIRQFLRAVRNEPDNAAEQLRSFVVSSLETTVSRFELSALVNTDPAKVEIGNLEKLLRQRVEEQVLNVYGIAIAEVGLERLTLPNETLSATVNRMRAERQTVATQRVAEGQRAAAEIRSNADRDARIVTANARAEAADIEAKARVEAAGIYARAYRSDPKLYTLLRSLDTLDAVVGDNTRLILRTDAAPFRVFVDGPSGAAGAASAATGAPEAPPPRPSAELAPPAVAAPDQPLAQPGK
jgi:membrane protease subunit HflC